MYGNYVGVVGQGASSKPTITAHANGVGFSNSVSTFNITPGGPAFMTGGAPIRMSGSRNPLQRGQALPGGGRVLDDWHATNFLGGIGLCPEVCYQWEMRWSRELRLDGVSSGTPMYLKAEVRLHADVGYEFWSYPLVPVAAYVGVHGLALSGGWLAAAIAELLAGWGAAQPVLVR